MCHNFAKGKKDSVTHDLHYLFNFSFPPVLHKGNTYVTVICQPRKHLEGQAIRGMLGGPGQVILPPARLSRVLVSVFLVCCTTATRPWASGGHGCLCLGTAEELYRAFLTLRSNCHQRRSQSVRRCSMTVRMLDQFI